ncbi:MAG: ankyrin repeat domain-containing protein [Planctomycetaceae bacterium]
MPHKPTPDELRGLQQFRKGFKDSGSRKSFLCSAAAKGWVLVYEEAIHCGLDINSPVWRDYVPLVFAVANSQVELAAFLLNEGADPNTDGVMCLCAPETLQMLIDAGGCIDGKPNHPRPLIKAIRAAKDEKFLSLMAAGADVNVRESDGMTPLMHAARFGRVKKFLALVEAGADLYALDNTGRSVMRYAFETVANGSHETTIADRRAAKTIVRRMKGMLPAQPEDDILMDICTDDARSMRARIDDGLAPDTLLPGSIGILGIPREVFFDRLKPGTDLTAELTSGHFVPKLSELDSMTVGATLLMWAVAAQRTKCVKLLLERGADPNRPDGNGISAAGFCIRAKTNWAIAEMMGTIGTPFSDDLRGRKFTPTIGPYATRNEA